MIKKAASLCMMISLFLHAGESMKKTDRKADYPIHDLILHRWSPRAMSGEAVSDQELMTLFEAARWAPSSYNGQPWHFVYAKKDTPHWQTLFDLMVSFNQGWAKNAGALVVIVSRTTFDFNNKPSKTHAFDTGSAWQNLALQGAAMDLVIHGMEGFSYSKAKEVLNIPDGYIVQAMFSVGKPAPVDVLEKELQEREAPSDRKKINEFVFEGSFKK